MPLKEYGPEPKEYPCRIGIDFWRKKNKKKGKPPTQVFYKYTDAKIDEDGWTDPSLWLPLPFDLCWLKLQDRTRTGWWTGKVWEGLRVKPEDTVVYWKKCHEDMK